MPARPLRPTLTWTYALCSHPCVDLALDPEALEQVSVENLADAFAAATQPAGWFSRRD
jgi:hypothetical protein